MLFTVTMTFVGASFASAMLNSCESLFNFMDLCLISSICKQIHKQEGKVGYLYLLVKFFCLFKPFLAYMFIFFRLQHIQCSFEQDCLVGPCTVVEYCGEYCRREQSFVRRLDVHPSHGTIFETFLRVDRGESWFECIATTSLTLPVVHRLNSQIFLHQVL